MRDIGATKDTHEREEAEAERLVRPAPKVKPPRDDAKREHIRPERDPDTDGDKDTKADPDLSLNRKKVAGSMAERLAAEWVRVRNKTKDEVTRVHPDTLRDDPDLYEKVPDNEPHRDDGIRPPRKPPRVHKPHYHKDHLPHPKWPDPRPQPKAAPRPPMPPETPKTPAVPEPPEPEKQPKVKPPGWVRERRNLKAALVGRWLRQAAEEGEEDLVTVRRKEDGKVVRIKPDTLKETPSAYEQLDEDEEGDEGEDEGPEDAPPEEPEKPSPKDDAKPDKPPSASPKELYERGEHIRNLLKGDPAMESRFKGLSDPTNPLRVISDKVPAGALLGGAKIQGIETVSDIMEALAAPKPPPEPEDEDAEGGDGKSPKGKPDRPAVTRPPATPEDKARAQRVLIERLGPHQAKKLLKSGLHPHDAETVAAAFDVAKRREVRPSDLDDYVDKSKAFFQTDPDKVGPPAQGKDAKGVVKPYKELTPKEQGEAWQDHRNKVVAMSLAVRRQVFDSYKRMGAPKALAQAMVAARLGGGKGLAAKVFSKAMADPDEGMSPGKAKHLFDTVKDPATREVAAAYLQGRSYQDALHTYLDPSSSKAFHERMPAGQIAGRLTEATGFLRGRDKGLPEDVPKMNLGRLFRTRIYNRLAGMDAKKADKLLPYLDTLDAEDYRTDKKAWKKQHKGWTQETKAREKKRQKLKAEADREAEAWKAGDPAKRSKDPPLPFEERIRQAKLGKKDDPAEPPKPLKPPRYEWRPKSQAEAEKDSKDLFDDLVKSLGGEGKEPKTKTACLLLGRTLALSSCTPRVTMTRTDRTAVYWGVDPYPEDQSQPPYAYQGWEQARARDLGESDFQAILTAAKERLRSPPLSPVPEGMVPDARYRAALDLAIRETGGGRYSVGVHPTIYNTLLARLAQVRDPGTLQTIREASESSYPPVQEKTMKPSIRLRAFAQKFASDQPALAYDLIELADKFAEDEQADQAQQKQAQQDQQDQGQQKQGGEMPPALKKHMEEKAEGKGDQDQGQDKQAYVALKTEVVKVAHENPAIRAALLPALKLIKAQG